MNNRGTTFVPEKTGPQELLTPAVRGELAPLKR